MRTGPYEDTPDLTGKVAIVTGGNSGIGFATVQQLARKGAKVYLAARTESKATGALARLDAEGRGPGNGEVVWLKLDLSDPKAAKQAAEEFVIKEKRLDILVNNGAMLMSAHVIGPLGIQETMIVNYFSPIVFTHHLLPLLSQTAKEPNADVRIVNVASNAQRHVPDGVRYRCKEDFNISYKENLNADMIRYGSSKLAVILGAEELQRRMDAGGIPIICISIHPGTVNSEGLIKYLSSLPCPLNILTLWISSVYFYTSAQGAHSLMIGAASPTIRADPSAYKGALMGPMGEMLKKPKPAQNPELATELWDSTEKLLREMDVWSPLIHGNV